MTTRHLSAQTDYPFVPLLNVSDADVVGGITDLYFVITGESTYDTGSSSSSTSSGQASCPYVHDIRLVSVSVGVSDNTYVFSCRENNKVWNVTFTVPRTAGTTGQVSNDDGSDARAVLLYVADDLYESSDASSNLEVEPARAQWHTEKVDSLGIYNIERCNGDEDPTSLEEVASPTSSASSTGPVLRLADGYNCEISRVSEAELRFNAGNGLGKGVAEELGDVGPCASSAAANILDDVISTVNGLAPINGDIPVTVSGGLGKQRGVSELTVIVRQS